MSKSKIHTPALGADYSAKMKSRYAEKVKPSGKIYTKADRRDNRVVENMTEELNPDKKEDMTTQGGCLCGAVRFKINGKLRPIINCHCGQCLHTHGHYAAYSAVEKNNIQFVSDSGLKWFRSSNEARRGFCQECGASLFWERLGENKLSVAAGMLDSVQGIKTIGHIFIADKADYYEIDDDLPKYTQSSKGELEGDS